MKDKALNDICRDLQAGLIGQALRAIENYLLMHQTAYYDVFNAINDDYRLMLDYFSRGYPDNQRDEVYHRLLRRLYVLVANIDWDRQVASSSYLSSLRRQVQQGGYDWSVPAVRHELEEYVSAMALLELEQEHVRRQKALDLHQRHQQYMSLLFGRIVTSGQWKESEGQAFADLLLSPTVSDIDQQLLVSAVMLSCFQMFDYEKFHALLTVYRQTPDELVRQRALVGWAMVADFYLKEIYPSMLKEVDDACHDERTLNELTELQMQLVYCLHAEQDTQVIQKEIMPELMKGNNLTITPHGLAELDEDRLEEILHPDAAEQNMERMEESMHRMVDMQKQGADIYFGGFSQMKRFPFFNDLSNWFVPYYTDHPAISRILKDTRGRKFLQIITKVGAFCDSDKYSFVLGFEQVLSRIPESMLKLIDEGEAIPTPVGGEITLEEQQQPAFMRRMYLQDLYRFYRVFAARSTFVNPFEKKEGESYSVPLYLFFANEAFSNTSLSTKFLEVVSFMMKRKMYEEARMVFLNFPSDDDMFRYWLLAGHLNAVTAHNIDWTCECYRRAWLLRPDDEKVKACLARTCFKCEKIDEALTLFRELSEAYPDHLGYQLNTAICMTRVKAYDDAMKILFRLNYEHPDNLAVMRALAWAETLTGKFDQARRHYARLTANAENHLSEDLLNHGFCLWLSRDIQGAADLFRRYLAEQDEPDYEILGDIFFNEEHDILASNGISDAEINLMIGLAG